MQSRATWSGRPSPVKARRVVCLALVAAGIATVGASSAIAARPTKGAEYEWSSGAKTVNFTVSRRGATLKDVFILVAPLPCSNGRSGGAFLLDLEHPWRLPIARDGSFSGVHAADREFLDPFAVSEDYSLSGSFTRGGRAARLVFRVRQVGEGGTVCDSGDRRVTARRSRRS